MLTATRLRELLSYDPETGVFTWRVNAGRWGRLAAGSIAGSRHCEGYLTVRLDGKAYLLHRLAFLYMTGEWPAVQVDHEKGDRSDNRWIKLRAASRSQNIANAKRYSSNTSGLKGVSKRLRDAKWIAQICIDQRREWLGAFDTKEEAHAAYLAAADRHFGQFARVE